MALLNEGKLPEAIAAFEKYLSLAPEGQYAAQAKAMLAQLKKM
jgi:TolA-binding protein